MKKALCLVLLLICSTLLFTACGNGDPSAEESEITLISCEDGYDNAGFVSFKTEKAGTYTFTPQGDEDVEWAVYLFDEEFSDGPRYILQAAEPLLTEGGSLTLEEGKFVYVYCSANAFTDLAPDSDAKFLVTFAE